MTSCLKFVVLLLSVVVELIGSNETDPLANEHLLIDLSTTTPPPSPQDHSETPPVQFDDVEAPKRFSTNPFPGENMDKALGMKKKSSGAGKSSRYPWDSSQKQPIAEPTDAMKDFMYADEEPFAADYYEDYDFEFAKGGIRNDNFELKSLFDQARRMQEYRSENSSTVLQDTDDLEDETSTVGAVVAADEEDEYYYEST